MKPLEHTDVAAMQAVILFRKIGRHQARGEQRAVEPISPRMVGTGEARDLSLRFGADQRATMPAHIVERVDGGVIAADDDDGFAAHLEQEVIALVAHPVDVARNQPLAADHLLHVGGEHVRVAVQVAIQAIAALGFRCQRRDDVRYVHFVVSDGIGAIALTVERSTVERSTLDPLISSVVQGL